MSVHSCVSDGPRLAYTAVIAP
eukprot:SAG31_NODE_21878_length_538_cov_4.357631_1_plen_21_part_01